MTTKIEETEKAKKRRKKKDIKKNYLTLRPLKIINFNI